MWKHKLCLGTNDQFDCDDITQIRLFHKIGFDGFFAGWSTAEDMRLQRAEADALGMLFQSVHAPFYRMKEMWEDGDGATAELNNPDRSLAVDLFMKPAIASVKAVAVNKIRLVGANGKASV